MTEGKLWSKYTTWKNQFSTKRNKNIARALEYNDQKFSVYCNIFQLITRVKSYPASLNNNRKKWGNTKDRVN